MLVTRFGPRATQPLEVIEVNWAEERWTRGCSLGHFPTGVLTQYGRRLREPVARIHWAGTETATVSYRRDGWCGALGRARLPGDPRRTDLSRSVVPQPAACSAHPFGPRPGTRAHPEVLAEEGERLVEGRPRRRALFVDQMMRQHRVRVLGVPVGVARRRVDLHGEELVPQLAAQRLEALREAEGVVGEAQAEKALARLRTLLDPGQVGVRDADVGLVLLADAGTAVTAGSAPAPACGRPPSWRGRSHR